MKKITGLFLFGLLFAFAAFSQNYNIPKIGLDLSKGQTVPSIVDGQVIYAQESAKKVKKSKMDIPEELSNGVVIVSYQDNYFYQGRKRTITCQLVYSNIKPDASLKKASEKSPISVAQDSTLGVATGEVTIVIRIRDLDPYLAFCAKNLPLEVGSFWYFGLESLMPDGDKYLIYQPIESKETEITFPDGLSESLEHLITARDPQVFSSFPPMPVRFKAVMNSYPVNRHNPENAGERNIFSQYQSNMQLEATADFEGFKLHFYFSQIFADYFKEEYKLGDEIWLYGNILYVLNGELYLYGWDFTLSDPEEHVTERQNQIIMLNRQGPSIKNKEVENKAVDTSAGDYVDMTQEIPKGGYATYLRFFILDSKTGEFKENTGNIEIKYFDKNGKLTARMLWYDNTDLVRNTTTYKYDKQGRLIERCNYDSDMFQKPEGGWTVDPARSRIFIKDVTEYTKTSDGGYEAITQSYRYSYKPRVEHPDDKVYEKYNKQGILIKRQNISAEDSDLADITEYDEHGNIIYSKYDIEKPYEDSYEYVYDGDKIIKGILTEHLTGKVTEWTCEYDEKGLLTKKIFPTYFYEYRYNSDGKCVEEKRTNTDTGFVPYLKVYRYDKKTGIMIFEFEDSDYSGYKSTRYWYTELSKETWHENLDPYKLMEELPE